MRIIERGALFLQSRMTVLAGIVTILYSALAHYLPFYALAEGWRLIQMALAATVITAYWPHGRECFFIGRGRWPDQFQLIALAIVLSWLSIFGNGCWGMLWRLSGQPGWMVNNDLYQSWVAMNTVAATLHIAAPNLLGAGVPTGDRVRLGGFMGGAVAILLLLSITRPDMSHITELGREWLEEPLTSRGQLDADALPNCKDETAVPHRSIRP